MAAVVPQSSTTIYAELLANIRQVSVAATLPSQVDATTSAEIIEDGKAIRVKHQGQTQSLSLPADVAALPALPIPGTASSRLNWRLPLSPAVPRPDAFSLENQAVPWGAKDLVSGSPIRCRKCAHPIIAQDTISFWKDLPSENWAEMMEFWHCHKPHDHNHGNGHAHDHDHSNNGVEEDSLVKRGYGASNAISAKPGVGFVDLVSFMFAEDDCNDILVSVIPRSSACMFANYYADYIQGEKKLA